MRSLSVPSNPQLIFQLLSNLQDNHYSPLKVLSMQEYILVILFPLRAHYSFSSRICHNFYEDSVPDAEQLGEDIRAFIHNSFNDMNEDNITVLLYPRNINKLNVLKPLTTDENSAITFNYWWLLGPLFIGLLFITIFIFIKYRQKADDEGEKDDILSSTV